MITRLDIENLKSFHGPSRLDLGPITLVYGPNSAGKSSLIQALALLKQSIDPRSPQRVAEPELVFSGAYVDLGSFLATINGHDADRSLGIGLGFVDPAPDRGIGLLAEEPIYAGLRFGLSGERSGPREGRAHQQLARLGDGDDVVDFARRSDGKFMLASDEDTRRFLKLIASRREIHLRNGNPDDDREAENLDLLRQAVAAAFDAGRRPVFLSSGLFPCLPMPDFLENRTLDMNLGLWFEEYLFARARVVTEILDKLAYLGPLRSLPSRFQALGGQEVDSVGFTGEHMTRLLADRPELVDGVNRWLRRLNVKYDLAVLPLSVRDNAQIEVGELVTTSLVHRESGVAVTPRDVGFGISQMLPIVVQLLVNERSTICIEQPEVHIHPRLQAELADLLIESVDPGGRHNQVIVETHSESLMLRIQRRIAEGTLDPASVSVMYIDDDGGQAKPTSLSLDAFGYFEDAWPDGFFAERKDDLFSRSIASLRAGDGGPPAGRAQPRTVEYD